jgi:hypothetical protein
VNRCWIQPPILVKLAKSTMLRPTNASDYPQMSIEYRFIHIISFRKVQ